MRISFILIIQIFFFSFIASAQVIGGYNEKLAKLYNAGKYESCLFKADNLTYKESTSRDPEPYLYISMCFLELSKSEDPIIQEDYKDGEKQAIKYASKFVRKDKDGEMYDENIEFINKLKAIQYNNVKKYFDEENYRRAASAAKIYAKLNREVDYSILYFVGACELLSNNFSQGSKNVEMAKLELKNKIKAGSFRPEKQFSPLISKAFAKYSEFLVADNKIKEASSELNLGLKIFPNDGFLKIQSNMVNKKLESNN